MRTGEALLWTTTIIAGAAVVCPSGVWYFRARARAADDLSLLKTVSRQAGELLALKGSSPPWTLTARPQAGLTPRISAAVQAAGLPPTALSSVSPEAESPIGDGDLKGRHSRAVLTLTGITLAQLGSFLKTWRTQEPQWIVSALDLTPQGVPSAVERAGGDLPLRVVVTLETFFVESPDAQKAGFVRQEGR